MLPRLFADALGIFVDEQRPGSIRGFDESPIVVHPADAKIEIFHQGQSFRWRAALRFGPSNHSLLGQIGCLEYFIATFDHYRRSFELDPNERYRECA